MSLTNPQFVLEMLNREAPWSESHGADGSYLGVGLMYYALVYTLRAKVAICLGSGGGFVPRLMRQAQRDLALEGSETILVDAIMPEAGWGEPKWIHKDSFFRTHYPEVRVYLERTDVALERLGTEGVRADMIHIDADHSFRQVKRDFERAAAILGDRGVISLHDTEPRRAKAISNMGVPRLVRWVRRSGEWDVLEFSEIAAGTAIVRRKPQNGPKLFRRLHSFLGLGSRRARTADTLLPV